MPESKGRREPRSRIPADKVVKDVKAPSPRWLVPVMLTCLVVGLLWIVTYYLALGIPVMSDLGNWNLLIGFGLIMVGFGLSTRWR